MDKVKLSRSSPHWIIEDVEFYCSVCNKAYPIKGITGSPNYGYDPRHCHKCSNCNSIINYLQVDMNKDAWDELQKKLDSYLIFDV